MTKLLDYLRSLESSAIASEIVVGYNVLESNYVSVPAHRVIAWMGEAGRLSKINRFLADTEISVDVQILGLRAAVNAVLLGVANPNTVIEVNPDSPHRQLLATMVTVGVLSANDESALVARGYAEGFTPATLESAAIAIAQRDTEDAAAARKAAYETRRNEWAVQAYKVGDDELTRAFTAGESLPTVNDLLAFVAASRGEGV